ncbi:MAG: iron ABC transporter permease [Actinomycetota bacterium]
MCTWQGVSALLLALIAAPIGFSAWRDRKGGFDGARPSGGASKHIVILPASIGLLIAVALLSLRCGSLEVTTGDAWRAIFDFNLEIREQIVVRELRAPRTLIGATAGACLAVAGSLTQGVTRNPLGAPGILGINAGASFAIVTAIFLAGVVSPLGYVWFAFVGAAGAAMLVYSIASVGRGGASPVKLALSGAIVTALLFAWTTSLLLLDQETLDQARFWLAGSIAGRRTEELQLLFPLIAIALVVALFMGRQINLMSLGDDVAAGLGQRTGVVRGAAGLVVVILAGSAVAIAGPVGFVGLAVPHMVRAIVGPDYRWITLYSLILGPCLLLGADIIGRIVVRPSELQVGIVTAAVGAPFLIYLVRFTKLSEL